jgi:hypothetical protein
MSQFSKNVWSYEVFRQLTAALHVRLPTTRPFDHTTQHKHRRDIMHSKRPFHRRNSNCSASVQAAEYSGTLRSAAIINNMGIGLRNLPNCMWGRLYIIVNSVTGIIMSHVIKSTIMINYALIIVVHVSEVSMINICSSGIGVMRTFSPKIFIWWRFGCSFLSSLVILFFYQPLPKLQH